MKTTFSKLALVLSMICIIAFASPIGLFASSLDDLSSGSTTNSGSTTGSPNTSNDSSALSDYLQGYTPITDENMGQASKLASPIVNILGTVSGLIVMVVSAAIFVITALDLAYIGLPFTRALLNPTYGGGAPAGGAPMGGMGMGMGMGMRGGMGMGGMGMGAPAGGAGMMPEHGLRRRWVSDEAVFVVNTYANPQAQGGAMGGGMSPMGGMGGMGGMGMMGGMPQQQAQPMPTKSVIFEYLKKRIFFLIVFALATVVLMSSIFTDCGINLAELLTKIMDKVNGQITTFNP